MKGYPTIYLLAVALAAASFGTSAARAAAPACTLSAAEIRKEIQEKGTEEFVQRATGLDYGIWTALNDCISSGSKDWLDIASIMLKTVQPDTEDDLTLSVADALPRNPESVLAESWPDYFSINGYICTGNLIEEFENYDAAIAELNRRVAIVQKLNRPDLKSKIDACLAGFEQARKEIADWYKPGQKTSGSGARLYVSIGLNQPLMYADDDDVPPAPDPGTSEIEPRQRGGSATFPASHPITPAGPPALSLRGRSPYTASPPPAPDPGTAPPAPDPGTAPPPPDPGTAPPPPDPGTAPPPVSLTY